MPAPAPIVARPPANVAYQLGSGWPVNGQKRGTSNRSDSALLNLFGLEIAGWGRAEAQECGDTGYVPFRSPPSTASWQHQEARSGFEVAYFQAVGRGWVIDGTTAAVEDGQTRVVTYSIKLDAAWVTRGAHIEARTVSGSRETRLESDGAGRWLINGAPAPDLNGCMDVDLESSSTTRAGW